MSKTKLYLCQNVSPFPYMGIKKDQTFNPLNIIKGKEESGLPNFL